MAYSYMSLRSGLRAWPVWFSSIKPDGILPRFLPSGLAGSHLGRDCLCHVTFSGVFPVNHSLRWLPQPPTPQWKKEVCALSSFCFLVWWKPEMRAKAMREENCGSPSFVCLGRFLANSEGDLAFVCLSGLPFFFSSSFSSFFLLFSLQVVLAFFLWGKKHIRVSCGFFLGRNPKRRAVCGVWGSSTKKPPSRSAREVLAAMASPAAAAAPDRPKKKPGPMGL